MKQELMNNNVRERMNDDVPDSAVIKYLIKENKSLRVQLGQEHAYIQELEDKIKHPKQTATKGMQVSFYEKWSKDLQKRLSSLEQENEKLKQDNDFLLSQVDKFMSVKCTEKAS